MLTKHQIQDYNKNGFIVIEELLTKDEIKQNTWYNRSVYRKV